MFSSIPEGVSPGVACRQTTAPHASRVERTRLKPTKPGPHGRDFLARDKLANKVTRFACCNDCNREASPKRSLHRHGFHSLKKKENEESLSASPEFPISIVRECHWIERWDYSDLKSLRNKWSMNSIGITPTSLHRSERTRLHVLSAKGQQIAVATELPVAIGSWQGFRFLSAVDETTFPEPVVPVRRRQLNHSSSDHYRDRLRANAFSHEHDDRRVENSPTPRTISVPAGMSRKGLSCVSI